MVKATGEPTEISKKIGARVRALRAESGLSQQQLAVRSGLTRSSVANIEAGRQDMGLERAALVARGLGVQLSALLPEGDLPPLPPEPHKVKLRQAWEAVCETCGITLLSHPDKGEAISAKNDHEKEMK